MDNGTITPAEKSVALSRSSGYHSPPRSFRHLTTIVSDRRPENSAPTANATISVNIGWKWRKKKRTHVPETGREETGPDNSFVRDIVSHGLRVIVNAEESSKMLKLTYNCVCNRSQQNFIPYEPSALCFRIVLLIHTIVRQQCQKPR